MADDSVESLRERLRVVESELRDARDEAASRRTKARDLKEERDELARERDTLKAANDDLGKRAGAKPAELQARVDELSGKLRDVHHRAAFAKLARAAGVPEDDVPDLYQLSGYKPEADEADPAALTALVADQKAKRPRFFAETTTAAPAAVQAASPGPGHGKGSIPPPNTFKVTAAQMADPKWTFANQAAIRSAQSAGSLHIEPPHSIVGG